MTTIWWPSFCGNRSNYDALWSDDLTINTDQPDLTSCLHQTIITWLIYGLSILFNVLYIIYLRSRPDGIRAQCHSKFNIFKIIMCLITVLVLISLFACEIWLNVAFSEFEINSYSYLVPADYNAYIFKINALGLLCYVMWIEFKKGIASSGNMFLFWFFAALAESAILYSQVYRRQQEDPYVELSVFVVHTVFTSLVILQFLFTLKADLAAITPAPSSKNVHLFMNEEEKKPLLGNSKSTDYSSGFTKSAPEQNRIPSNAKPSPIIVAPFWSRISFMWFGSLVIQGYKKALKFDDLPDISDEEKTQKLLPLFDKYYKQYLNKKDTLTSNFNFALCRSILKYYLKSSAYRLIALPISFTNPQLVSLLIAYISLDSPPLWQGLCIAGCMLIVNFLNTIVINNFLFTSGIAGMHARSIVNAVVYRKALKLSSAAKRQTTVGQIVNLMSVDAQKVQEFFLFTTLLWSVPLMIIIAMYFLYVEIGASCFAGFAVLCILVPLNAMYFAKKAMQLQRGQMLQKDNRFRVMNEILAGMKVLKLYAWEPSFEDKVIEYREEELKNIKYANYINAFGSMCWLLSPYLVSLATFAAYVLSGGILDADKAFVTLSLINLLNWPMSLLPMGVNNTVQGLVSMRRISQFLLLEELEDDTTNYGSAKEEIAIKMDNCTYSWGKRSATALTNINFEVPRGSLVAIVGQVGCGKSSLINALLGELYQYAGDTYINGKVAYVPQQAWIQNDTLKGNIIFHKALKEDTYKSITDACALTPDLAMLPGGDMTEIGEKGINLSGGQKQRVSLARAVYQNSDIYMLDDPLSAVDSHVGKHIFEKVIGPHGLLRRKTRVLVTHGITYLPFVDHIYVMNEGRITEHGKYEDLLTSDGEFAHFINDYINEYEPQSEAEAAEMDRILSVLSSVSESGGDSGAEQGRRRRYSSQHSQASSVVSESGTSQRRFSKMQTRNSSTGSGGVRRRPSRQSKASEDFDVQQVVEAKKAKLIQEETSQSGLISGAVLKSYIEAGSTLMMVLVCVSQAFFITSQIFTNLWLAFWSNDVPTNDTIAMQAQANYRLSVYGYLGIGQAIFALVEAFAVAQGCYLASRVLHKRVLSSIMHAPMSFFDTTPLGRILNRFSKDLDVVDTSMPLYIRQWLFAMAPVFTTIILICYVSPIFVAVIVPVIIMFIILQRMYIKTARQLKRIESVHRSPIYTHFDESISGATSIRAYRMQDKFINKCDRLIDESQRPWFLTLASYRWCAVCMESLGSMIVFFSALFAVFQGDIISASLAGMAVSYSLQITLYMNALVRNSSEMETYVTSIERIDEYTHIDSEAPWDIPEKKPPTGWPRQGTVKFDNYNTRYRPGLDLVLKNLNFEVKEREKVGIVGRTGAGKSSLSLALLRLIEPAGQGRIYIDNEDISEMGLHDLRSKLSIIPQDPVVFSGSLRHNLDPFEQYTDDDMWTALKNAHLQEFVSGLHEGLMYECGEGGEALSVGQRQLVCLARALLRKSRILILDEATAAVDLETDSLIQDTIRTQFRHATILTVAHRLSTVLDYDRIIVLDKGEIIEFDTPARLLEDRNSNFYKMAKDANLV